MNEQQPPSSPPQSPPPITQHEQPPSGLPLAVPPNPQQVAYHPNSDERTMAMLIHLLGIITGFLGPLILWLVKREESAFIDHHGKEMLNFMLTNLIASVILTVIAFVTFGLGSVLFVPWGIAVFVFSILACIAANNGVWHRIPMTIRFIN